MQKRQYVANTSVNFSDFRFFVKPGDLCKHHEDTGDFIIFRNGTLLAKLKISIMALKSMMTSETQFFTEIKTIPVSASHQVLEPSITIIEEAEEEETIVINENVPEDMDLDAAIELEETASEESETSSEGITVAHRKKRHKK